MDKIARKPSADPVQEKLRQDKAVWNKDMSGFITKVINFKKLINGAPNLFFKQKSKITQPVPSNPTAILSSLTSDFQELAQRGSGLVEEQLAYAKNHKPKQPKVPGAPIPIAPKVPATPVPDLSKQLAAWESKWESKYALVAEGSNPISRFLTRKTTLTRGTSEKMTVNRLRLNMLASCATARKALSNLQIQITRGSTQSIADSQKIMQHIWYEWAVVARNFNAYKSRKDLLPTSTKEIELPTDESMQPDKETLPEEINKKPTQLPEEKKISPVIVPTRRDPYPQRAPYQSPSVVKPSITPEAALPTEESQSPLEAVAQAFIKKWLGKKRHQYFPQQGTSAYRLEVFEIAKKIRVDLNQIMNLLEKGFNLDLLSPLVYQVNRQITTLRMLMRSLHLSEKPDAPNNSLW
jgi:hypothetical protein